jgi:hypothetical protein
LTDQVISLPVADDERQDPPTAQDVVDALRFAFGNRPATQDTKLVLALLDLAPESEDNRGVEIVGQMLLSGELMMVVA